MRQITEVDCIAFSLFPAESGAGRVRENKNRPLGGENSFMLAGVAQLD
jgi:hypothetical protein